MSARVPDGLRAPPTLSGALPIVGHTVEFLRGALELLARAERELGEVASFRVAHRRMVALFGPEAHETVFRAPDAHLNPNDAYKIMTPVFGEGVVYDAPPDKMDEQFKMLLPALRDRRMRTYGEVVVREVERSIEGWGDQGSLDLVDYCRVLTNFTSTACLLGREFRVRMTDEFARLYHHMEQGITPLAYLNAHLPLPSFRRRDRARVRLCRMVAEIVAERRRLGVEGEDFLQTLMDARYQSGTPLNEHEITGLLIAAMFAGHHTSSVTTAWALIELMQNRDWMRRAVDELDGVFGGGRPVEFLSLREIPVTEHVVKETLRLHPPLFMLVRTVMKDFTYKGYFIPAGSWVLVSPTVAHRMPSVFRDPDRFDPSRFAPPREEDKRDHAFIPFGGGRHKCLGNAFALMQVKAILALLLRRYDFELETRRVGSDFHGLVVGPTQPCRIRYRRRAARRAATAPRTVAAAPAAAPPATCPAHASAPAAPPPTSPAHGAGIHRPFRILIDLDVCQGHAVCTGEAPELFEVRDDKTRLILAHPPAELRARAERAARYCPTRALRVVDEATGEG